MLRFAEGTPRDKAGAWSLENSNGDRFAATFVPRGKRGTKAQVESPTPETVQELEEVVTINDESESDPSTDSSNKESVLFDLLLLLCCFFLKKIKT